MTRGDNSGKTRNTRRLFFHEESIHEVSRQYLEHEYVHTYIRTSRNQYVPHFFKVGGIKIWGGGEGWRSGLGGVGLGGGQGGCERRSEAFVKIQKKKIWVGGGGPIRGWGGGGIARFGIGG